MGSDLTLLDTIAGISKYSLGTPCNIYSEWYSYEDFIVEEILPDGTILELENPKLKSSGYPGLFTHFVLVKRNIDLFSVVEILSKAWGVPRSFIFFSGFKDKEAITVQRGCVFGIPPKQIVSTRYPKKIEILSPIRELRRVHIGEHYGNRFRVYLYNISGDLKNCITKIASGRLLNFFGYQRFGIWKPITHIAGKLLIQGAYRSSLLLFLYEINPLFQAKKELMRYLYENNYREALKLLPQRQFDFERYILKILMHRSRTSDTKDIIRYIPPWYIRIFLEAYQAFLYNRVLSKLTFDVEISKVPLIGYSLDVDKISNVELKHAIKEVLDEEKVDPKMFRKKQIKPYIARGGYRRSTIVVDNILVNRVGYNKYLLSFSLKKGSFATILIREILGRNTVRFLLMKKNITREKYAIMNRYYLEIIRKYYTKSGALKFFEKDLFS